MCRRVTLTLMVVLFGATGCHREQNSAPSQPSGVEKAPTPVSPTEQGAGKAVPEKAQEARGKAVQLIEQRGGKTVALFDAVTAVNLSNCKITDEDLKVLTALSDVDRLLLDGTLVTDAGLKDLVA